MNRVRDHPERRLSTANLADEVVYPAKDAAKSTSFSARGPVVPSFG